MPTEVTVQMQKNSPGPSEAKRQPTEISAVSAIEKQEKIRQDLQKTEQNLPADTENRAPSEAELGKAVEDLSSLVQNLKRELNFSVDEDSGHTIIKVMDSETGDLIRQIPREEVVKAAQTIETHSGILMNAKV